MIRATNLLFRPGAWSPRSFETFKEMTVIALLDRMTEDLGEHRSILAGYLLDKTAKVVASARDQGGEAGLEQAASSVEAMYDRVLHFRTSLSALEVPRQERDRHNHLLQAFSAYSDALMDLFDAFSGEEELYDSQIFAIIAASDRVLHRHRKAAEKVPPISTIL